MILEKAACEAKPTMAASTPAPVNSVVPTVRNEGIDLKITVMATNSRIISTAFLKKLYRVGSTFNFLAAPLKNRPTRNLRILEMINITTKTEAIKITCSQNLSIDIIASKIVNST